MIVVSCERNCQPEARLTRAVRALHLPQFVPFRLNRLAVAVSEYLSAIYRDRFGLGIPEWRVLVTVGPRRGCTAQYIAASTRMHKTRVSRAVAALARRGCIARAPSASDGREVRLKLTPAGRRIYSALVPLALERERTLLSGINAAQRRAFLAGMARLEARLGLAME
jgi:DNA-binding MarR family transcriptional regulator